MTVINGARDALNRAWLKRLLACLFGGVVLALMVGNQEGTINDFGVAFRKSVGAPRIFVFLGIGLVIYLLITFWPLTASTCASPERRKSSRSSGSISSSWPTGRANVRS